MLLLTQKTKSAAPSVRSGARVPRTQWCCDRARTGLDYRPMAVMCSGAGQPVVPSEQTSIYPACPVCGREFSSQGRKSRHYRHNYWQTGAPRHYPVGPGQ